MIRMVAVAILACTLGVLAGAVAARQYRSEKAEAIQAIVQESGLRVQPDTASENWHPLSSDVGIEVFTDRLGIQRGRLFVRIGGLWKPVAVEGPTEMMPDVVPLG